MGGLCRSRRAARAAGRATQVAPSCRQNCRSRPICCQRGPSCRQRGPSRPKLRPERPREAQRSTEGAWIEQACRELGWGLPTSRFMYDQGGSPQADLRPGKLPTDFCMEPKRKPPRTTTRVPNRNPLQTQGLPTSRIMYDQGGSPQAELRPGRLPTSRITTRAPTHKQNYDQGAGWLVGWRN